MFKMIKIGGQFSGVGAFDYALDRLGIDYLNIYQAEWDKYARQSYLANHKEPKYYVKDVQETPIQEITEKEGRLDLMMFSPPCQAFSLAGKRKGKADKRGVLFFNSLEFIQVNNPRYFIFENVKGLLSDDNGNTFQEWVNYLGGKSVNGAPVLFEYENSVPYHLYYKVLNSKKHGVPQNRERIFLVGIRDDIDNDFSFPKEEHLKLRLKDVLEDQVDEKYFLSDKLIECFVNHEKTQKEKGRGFKFNVSDGNKVGSAVTTKAGNRSDDNFIKIKSNTLKGYDIATENDSINFAVPNSETRRGRVGKGVAQTLDTQCNQGVIIDDTNLGFSKEPIIYDRFSPTLRSERFGLKTFSKDFRIRKLTPLECFRLQDFPDSHVKKCVDAGLSNSSLYKQAGNSITVRVLELIIRKLKL